MYITAWSRRLPLTGVCASSHDKKASMTESHLSENFGEIAWVQELCPDTSFYGEAYNKYGMFGNDCKTIMAHCVHSTENEIKMMKDQGVFIAHCPESNTNLSSGVAPIRKYLDMGMKIGLGSDVAAGSTLSMFTAMSMAIQCSKLRWRLSDQELKPLNIEEVFYLATRGGGEFFGKVGTFEKGYEFVSADIKLIPQTTTVLDNEGQVKSMEKLIDLLEDDDDVQNVYHNWEITE